MTTPEHVTAQTLADLNRRQHQRLNRDLVILHDVADIVVVMAEAIRTAHRAAATLGTGDSPPSGWGNGSTRPTGTHSDPTGGEAVAAHRVTDELDELHRRLAAFRDTGYAAHDQTQTIIRRLNAGGGREAKRTNDELHDTNIGRGNCSACDTHCEGQGSDRLRTVRPAGTLRSDIELRFCDACYQAWRSTTKDHAAEIWTWCEQRRRRVERSERTPS